jgi:hypothetical protein
MKFDIGDLIHDVKENVTGYIVSNKTTFQNKYYTITLFVPRVDFVPEYYINEEVLIDFVKRGEMLHYTCIREQL